VALQSFTWEGLNTGSLYFPGPLSNLSFNLLHHLTKLVLTDIDAANLSTIGSWLSTISSKAQVDVFLSFAFISRTSSPEFVRDKWLTMDSTIFHSSQIKSIHISGWFRGQQRDGGKLCAEVALPLSLFEDYLVTPEP